MRKFGVVLLLACAGAQPAASSAVLASAVAVALHGYQHEHSGSVVAAGGRLHLVLSHDESGGDDHAGLPHIDDPGIAFLEGDHVLHLDEQAEAAPRRVVLDFAPPLATPVAMLAAPAPRWALRLPPEPRARGVDHLRTVVLLL